MKKQLTTVLSICLAGISLCAATPKGASLPEKLIDCERGLMCPVWSPDGKQIAVTTDNFTGILVARADGSELRTVTNAEGAGYRMAWNSNSTRIMGDVKTMDGRKVKHSMHAWNVADGKEVRINASQALQKAPSWMATNSAYDIMLQDPAGAASRIDGLKQWAGKTVINPALSPDGTTIAFQFPGMGVFTCAADGSSVKSLCAGSHPAWLPDSQTLVVSLVKDNGAIFTSSDLYAVDSKTGAKVLLTGATDMIPMTPAVSPDGRKVAFENAADANIYVITLKY